MSAREPVLNRAVDNLITLLHQIRTGTGAFFDYNAVYDGWAPDPPVSPAIQVILGSADAGERSAGREEDAVVVRRRPVRVEARQTMMVQADLAPRTVAVRMLCDLQRIPLGHHDLGGTSINLELESDSIQILGDSEVEIVVALDLVIVYQTLLTDPTRES